MGGEACEMSARGAHWPPAAVGVHCNRVAGGLSLCLHPRPRPFPRSRLTWENAARQWAGVRLQRNIVSVRRSQQLRCNLCRNAPNAGAEYDCAPPQGRGRACEWGILGIDGRMHRKGISHCILIKWSAEHPSWAHSTACGAHPYDSGGRFCRRVFTVDLLSIKLTM